jgi:predicted MFS family arabinose efflux permease
MAEGALSDRKIVLLVGAVQFVNILDFIMVMPLGPDFTRSLGFSASRIGLVGGAYTAAACVSGLAGALFLDRFDRRSALAVAMVGLILGTAAGGLATSLPTLMAARVLAGAFGGPATSVSLAIIADAIPAERRGKALGAVMGAFAAASVLGVPAGLELARIGTWRLPFFAVAALGLVVTAAVVTMLPPFRAHLGARREVPSFAHLFRQPVVLLSWAMTASVMLATFSIVPNLSSYFLFNLDYPRTSLSSLYLIGGTLSFFASRLVGLLVDRYGSFRVGTAGTLWFVGVLYTSFVSPVRALPVMAIFLGFMLSNSFRGVPHNTLTSKVPAPAERARFMSIQSAVQHFASSLGAVCSTFLLVELPDGKLEGMPRVAALSLTLAALFPFLARAVESRVATRATAPAPEAPATPRGAPDAA